MFQKNEVDGYKKICVSEELKNRTFHSIKVEAKRRQKQRTGQAIALASLCLMLFVGGIVYRNDSVLAVNSTPVLNKAVQLESYNEKIGLRRSSLEQEAQITVPLEVNVSKKAQISVTSGTIWRTSQEESEGYTELEITEKTVVYWTIIENADITPVCTITVGNRTYTYMVTMDEENATFYIEKEK